MPQTICKASSCRIKPSRIECISTKGKSTLSSIQYLLSKSSNWVLDCSPPIRGGNSSSKSVGLLSSLPRAFSRAVVASFRRSPWMSRPLDADLSKGEMSLGRGVRNSLVVTSHSKAIDLVVGRMESGTNDEAGARSKNSARNCGRCIVIYRLILAMNTVLVVQSLASFGNYPSS